MTTSKVTPNATILSKIDTTTNLNSYNRDGQQRNTSSKRTMTTRLNNCDQLVDGNTTALHRSRTQGVSRTNKQKDKFATSNRSPSKAESGSEEAYTASLNNGDVRISSLMSTKHHGMSDYIRKDSNEDADEESTAVCTIMRKSKTPIEHNHQLATPTNNSAILLQQQGTGDHYHYTNAKQYKSRSKTGGTLNRKYHRLIDQQDFETSFDERNAYRWRIFMYIITILILVFVIYRFLLAVWPKRKKTFMEQFVDDISNFLTP